MAASGSSEEAQDSGALERRHMYADTPSITRFKRNDGEAEEGWA
jgi:hypothetical protein